MDAGPRIEIDHRNGDTLDNRRKNLRVVTKNQNQQNRHHVEGRSRFKGVGWCQYSWRAYIKVNQKFIHIGMFPTEEDAARAYDVVAREHFGEFACTNADLYGAY